jgi:hypothetical protein
MAAIQQPILQEILPRQSGKEAIILQKAKRTLGRAIAKAKPAAPTPAPASMARPEKSPGAAAARSTASVPIRWAIGPAGEAANGRLETHP